MKLGESTLVVYRLWVNQLKKYLYEMQECNNSVQFESFKDLLLGK